jgi:hypothetical protein
MAKKEETKAVKQSDSGIPELITKEQYFKDYNARFGDDPFKLKPVIAIPDATGMDAFEPVVGQVVVVNWPACEQRYYLEFHQATNSVEQTYHHALSLMRDLYYSDVIKITDTFAASEQSAFFGAAAQRLGLVQDRVAQYLRVLNDMVKGMFQLVRELRWLDERLTYYDKSMEDDRVGADAEVTLKGIWIDLVEGGTKNPGSVLGMSQQLGFITLPELFFRLRRAPVKPPKKGDTEAQEKYEKEFREANQDLAGRIEGLEYNAKVKEVLGRKLTQYYVWKDSTEKELRVRRTFMIKYFRQYYNSIKLYMSWVKPYLKLIKRMNLDINKLSDKELIAAFEGSMIEVEVLARQRVSNKNPFYACLLLTIEHATEPKLSFALEGGFHRGPIHTGRTYLTWRTYSWTEEDIKRYRVFRDSEDFDLLKSIDSTMAAALDSVEGEIKTYLQEMGEEFAGKPEEKPEPKKLELFAPLRETVDEWIDPLRDLKDSIKDWYDYAKEGFKEKPETKEDETEKNWKDTYKWAKGRAFQHYKLFKSSNGMLGW